MAASLVVKRPAALLEQRLEFAEPQAPWVTRRLHEQLRFASHGVTIYGYSARFKQTREFDRAAPVYGRESVELEPLRALPLPRLVLAFPQICVALSPQSAGYLPKGKRTGVMANMQKSFALRLPVPVEFGAGCVEKVPAYLSGRRRALLVTGRHAMKKAGVTDSVRPILESAGIQCRLFDDLSAEPEHTEVEQAGAIARDFAADVVIGLGGGSAMDAAKAIAVAATHPGPIMDYILNGPRQITAATLPVLAITSTSGTGSHVGRVAVLSDRARKIKRALISDEIYPRAAFCDPRILRTMPPEVTAASGFDAFAQALEGFLSRADHPMGKLCAQESMRVIFRTLPEAVRNGGDLELRSRMAWGDTLGGISLATNAVVIPHVLAMVLGGRYGIPHGRAIATVMVACLKHSRAGCISDLAQVARLLGCQEHLSDEALADWAIEAIDRFIADLRLNRTILDYGVPEADLPSIAEETRTNFGLRIDVDPVPTDVAGLTQILRASISR
jgi:alcohol dehydrogenase class IV